MSGLAADSIAPFVGVGELLEMAHPLAVHRPQVAEADVHGTRIGRASVAAEGEDAVIADRQQFIRLCREIPNVAAKPR